MDETKTDNLQIVIARFERAVRVTKEPGVAWVLVRKSFELDDLAYHRQEELVGGDCEEAPA